MRVLIVIPLCLAAACSDDGDGNQAAGQAAPATLPAGQWRASWEVTAMRQTDHAPRPAVAAKVGDREQADVCVGKAEGERPNPTVFSDPTYRCSYQNSYIKDGMMTADLTCTRKGVTGTINMSMRGTYGLKSFEATVETTTYLPGPGDFAMSRKIGGTLGAASCEAAAAAPAVEDRKGA
jgi:hypothetical protein